jgi:hypothetical protein
MLEQLASVGVSQIQAAVIKKVGIAQGGELFA